MSDLINRSDINDVIDELEVYTCGRPNTMKVEISVLQLQRLINKLKNIQTAYDIDKVVAELESNSFITVKQEEVQTKRKDTQLYFAVEKEVVLLKDAHEIVKHGGASTDVCEWKLDGNMAINPHTFIKYKIKQYDSLYALDTCQYCGKKIKVVE